MKKNKLIYALIALATVVSCNASPDDIIDTPDNLQDDEGVVLQIDLKESSETEYFRDGDQICVQAYDKNGTQTKVSTYELSGDLFSSDSPIPNDDPEKYASYIAVYPDKCGKNTQFTATAGANQANPETAKQSNILVAKAKHTTAKHTNLDFRPVMSSIVVNTKVTRNGKPYPFKDVRFNAKLAQACDIIREKYAAPADAQVVEITPSHNEKDNSYTIIVASQSIAVEGFATLVTDINLESSTISMSNEILSKIDIAAGEQKVYNWEVELEPLSQKITEVSSSLESWIENEEISNGVPSDLDGDIEPWTENEEIKNESTTPNINDGQIDNWGNGVGFETNSSIAKTSH